MKIKQPKTAAHIFEGLAQRGRRGFSLVSGPRTSWVLREMSGKMKHSDFESHMCEGQLECGIGRRRAPPCRNYEQNVNKGADKKTEGFTLCFLLVALGANHRSQKYQMSHRL